MDIPVEQLLTRYGPLGLGWPIALWTLWTLIKQSKSAQDSMKETSQATREALIDNTEAITRLTTLFSERLPARGGGDD